MNMKKYIFGSVLLACVLAILLVFMGCPGGGDTGPVTGDEYEVSIGTITCSNEECPGSCTVFTGTKQNPGATKDKPIMVRENTQVRITPSPSDKCQLVVGSIKYNSTAVPTTGSGANRFNMPGQNVVITAQFEARLDTGPSYDEWLTILAGWKAELAPIIAEMTLEQKVGQMTQGLMDEVDGDNSSYPSVSSSYMGSMLAGGHNQPPADLGGITTKEWRQFTNIIVDYSLDTATPYPNDVKIPIIFGLDCMHGASKVMDATMLPHNVGLGAIAVGDPKRGQEVAYQAGQLTANEMLEGGLRWTFGPVLGTAEDIRWGRTYESYSENVETNGIFGTYFTRGLHETGVATCPKHFGPEGQTENGVNGGNAVISIAKYKDYILPYENAIKERTMSIMMTYGSRNGTECHEDDELMMELLKGEMGFQGMILTDWDTISQLSGANYTAQLANGVNAGIDMIMACGGGRWASTISGLTSNVNNGTIDIKRIDDAVMRILLFKKSIGHQSENPEMRFWGDDFDVTNSKMHGEAGTIRTQDHRDIAREMVADSLVLLKNENNIVQSLMGMNKILLVGPAADNTGSQNGGWTIEWQGQAGTAINAQRLTASVSIKEGIENKIGSKVEYSSNGSQTGTYDAIIAVVAENTYAEGTGDRTSSIDPREMSNNTISFLTTVKTNHPDTPIVLIIYSGRPITLRTAQLLDEPAAIIAAWWPGSEAGDGIADVLFTTREFVGKTPYTWYESIADLTSKTPLYAFGHGLKKSGAACTCDTCK